MRIIERKSRFQKKQIIDLNDFLERVSFLELSGVKFKVLV